MKERKQIVLQLTKLDSSGDAKLRRSTLTFTVNVSATKYKDPFFNHRYEVYLNIY